MPRGAPHGARRPAGAPALPSGGDALQRTTRPRAPAGALALTLTLILTLTLALTLTLTLTLTLSQEAAAEEASITVSFRRSRADLAPPEL